MNCHTAHQLLSAERDDLLSSDQRIALDAHLGDCSGCRTARSGVTASIATWRASTTSVKVPDVERAWQDIRRATRADQPVKGRRPTNALRWVAPLSLAAGLALVASVAPRWQNNAQAERLAGRETAYADFVDVPTDASSIVYVDDQSGWLVVWSDSELQPSGG